MTWNIVGHDWAVSLLQHSLAAGRSSHAYLFSGPPQVGKTTLALGLAAALNCSELDAPCGRCPSCKKIAQGTHPDVRVVSGEGAAGTIKIEQIRNLQRDAVLAPYEGRYRVTILKGMDRASLEAANSLLKTLEEPPGHLILGLTAVQAEALPATIVSRCQRLELRPVPAALIEAELLVRGLPPEPARLLARLSGGRLGWALGAVRDGAPLAERKKSLDQLASLLAADRVQRLDYAGKASQEPAAAARRLEQWLSWWRDLLLLCWRREGAITNIDRLGVLRQAAEQASGSQVLTGMKALQATAMQLEANVNTRLALEGLLLALPRWRLTPAGHDPSGASSWQASGKD